jgi:hypothetical protein
MNYILYNFDYIKENQQEIITELKISHDHIVSNGLSDSTGAYTDYNIFGVSSPSIHMYRIYEKVREIVREQLPESILWIQSWLNYQDYDGVLGWHNHKALWHGYISIEPQDTATEFEDWTIDNECGNIYFGPGKHAHRVVNLRKYSGKRITLGFDIMSREDHTLPTLPTKNFGAIPLL